jgi:RimJ/RimL family protein N-acetyltransferase
MEPQRFFSDLKEQILSIIPLAVDCLSGVEIIDNKEQDLRERQANSSYCDSTSQCIALIREMSKDDMTVFLTKVDRTRIADMTCRPLAEKSIEAAVADLWAFSMAKDKCVLGLYLSRRTPELIGRILLFDFNPRNRSAEIGYWLLDEFVGHGYMSAAIKALCKALLSKGSRLNKIYAQTAEFNTRSLKTLEMVGFRRDAVLREHHERGGELFSDYIYSLTAADIAAWSSWSEP